MSLRSTSHAVPAWLELGVLVWLLLGVPVLEEDDVPVCDRRGVPVWLLVLVAPRVGE